MMKNTIPIIIFIIPLFFIIPSSAEDNLFINPGFETGDTTNWTVYVTGGGSGAVAVGTGYKYSGSYGARLWGKSYNGGIAGNAYLYQNIDLTDIETIEFYVRILQADHGSTFYVMIDMSHYIYSNKTIGNYKVVSVNVSTFTGYHDVRFNARAVSQVGQGWCYAEMYIDDVLTIEDIPPTTSINFVPDVDETNNSDKPSFHYSINNSDWSNYHELRIRQWRYTMVNNEWTDTPYTEWWVVSEYPFKAVDYQSYLTMWPNTQDHTEPFHNWPYYFYPPHSSGIYIMKFEAVLYGADIYGSETILANDTMIYDSNYSYTSPPPEIPTAIPTAEPTPTPTYTPFPTTTPTAIPTPDPDDEGITNYTINKSGMGIFYDSVNGTIDNLNSTINGVSDFFLIPTHGMTNYINSVNVSFTNNTNQSIGHKYILSEIMIPFIYHFPLKIQLLISYYLTLLLILIILER